MSERFTLDQACLFAAASANKTFVGSGTLTVLGCRCFHPRALPPRVQIQPSHERSTRRAPTAIAHAGSGRSSCFAQRGFRQSNKVRSSHSRRDDPLHVEVLAAWSILHPVSGKRTFARPQLGSCFLAWLFTVTKLKARHRLNLVQPR